MQIVIVTGLSGAGKSTALRALEDIEFTCVDNIPVPLVSQMVDHLAHEGDRDKLAIAIDARQRRALTAWQQTIAKLRSSGHRLEVMFLDASDQVLLRRFSETRRRHPLSGDDVLDGIRRDRELMAEMRQGAAVVDTSQLNTHQLKAIIQDRYGGTGKLAVTFVSVLIWNSRRLPEPPMAALPRDREPAAAASAGAVAAQRRLDSLASAALAAGSAASLPNAGVATQPADTMRVATTAAPAAPAAPPASGTSPTLTTAAAPDNAPPPPAATVPAPSDAVLTAQSRFDSLADSLEHGLHNYHDRRVDFEQKRLSCTELAYGYRAADEALVSLAQVARDTRALDQPRRARYNQLSAGMDTVNNDFDASKCKRI